MKKHSMAVYLSAGTVLAVLIGGAINAGAVSANQSSSAAFTQSGSFTSVKWEETRVEKLRHAHYLLDHADGDYKGHKMEAMHSIEKAGKVLGVEIKGGGHSEESQWASDKKLTEARRILKELYDESGGKEQEHLHHAVAELDKALAIR
jgi:hypothetical protein